MLAPLLTQLVAQRGDWGKWQRNHAEKAFEHRRELYRDFIASATGYFVEMDKLKSAAGDEFEALKRVNAEIQLVSPPKVVNTAQKVIETFREIQGSGYDTAPYTARWHTEMNRFIDEARNDVLGGVGSLAADASPSAA